MQTLDQLLQKPGTIFGTHITIPHSSVVESMAMAGVAYLIIDRQHVAQNLETAERLIRDCKANGLTPFVRTLDQSPALIGEAFDIGAAAVIVPGIETREQAEKSVSAARYGPRGTRSACPFVPQAGLNTPDWKGHVGNHNDGCGIFALVETRKGINNIEEIANVPGVRGLMAGVVDLSVDMGCDGNTTHSDVLAAVSRAVKAASANGKEFLKGVHTVDEDAAATIISDNAKLGVRLFWLGNPTLFLQQAATRSLASAKKVKTA
ncbi:MAG: HpcH/HpaI aldolase family protein [Hyphomicrobiaceae bacterium]